MPARTTTVFALSGLILATFPACAFDIANVPVPQPRPEVRGAVDTQTTTASVAPRLAAQGSLDRGGSVARLKGGLDALSRGDVAGARATRDALPANALDRHILAWAIALSGGNAVSSTEISEAARSLSGWPGMAALRRNSERALAREKPAHRTVVDTFGTTEPQTVEGAVLLARAHVALSNPAAARAALAPHWRKERLEASEESAIIREFGSVLSAADHRHRMEQMLLHDRVNAAERVARLAGAEALAKAWGAVIRRERNALSLLDAVPRAQRTGGYFYARAKHLRWAGNYKQAAAVMLEAPREAAALVDPDAWWVERRVLSRELLDIGDTQTAYRIAAGHSAQSPAMAVDAEFHAGWYALRSLRDPARAAGHFGNIVRIAEGPISLSRGHYWLGRAAEAGGPGNARAHYEQAARFGTAFYGQLAAAKLGRSAVPASFPSPSETDRQNFTAREAVAAIRRLEEAGYPARADVLYRDLARQLTSPGELALLAVMAERRSHYLALVVGKLAAARGLDVGALAHPVGAIPSSARISGPGKALAYAIARQESEFNVGAVSGAGARGLLQLMPGTAREVARKSGMQYSQARLTTDPGYNATLGAAYLSEQLARFDGSYVLTFIGYNAGPSRATDWVRRYGDPRGADIDAVVDWIERIPFTETRHYVQRVMENYQVYKMRLSGSMNIAADLSKGR